MTTPLVIQDKQPPNQSPLFSYADFCALLCASIVLVVLRLPAIQVDMSLSTQIALGVWALGIWCAALGVFVFALAGIVDIYDRTFTARMLRVFAAIGTVFSLVYLRWEWFSYWQFVVCFAATIAYNLHLFLPCPKFRSSQSLARRIATSLYLQPLIALLLMLALPLLWLGVIYLGSLFALLIQSFFSLDGFTGQVVREFTLKTYGELTQPANRDIIGRTVVMAGLVTVTAALLAFPLAYYMARYAQGRLKGLMYFAVLVPLWSSYLVRVYTWKIILAQEGIITWVVSSLHLNWLLDGILSTPIIGGPSLSFSYLGMYMVFVYMWLPYMILPINAALERVPRSLLEASSDLGARPGYTFRKITLPLVFPGVVAGSIFTFSLTLGDYIIPGVIGNSSFFIGAVVLTQQGTAGNIPLAAAFTVVPIVIMSLYLLVAGRLGAFDAL
jgi:putative spermidine/putrescine transport system permease protein